MSSLFYANQCDVDEYVTVIQVAWSNVEPIVALACITADDRGRQIGQILFVNNEGAQISNSVITHASVPAAMAWHPDGRVLSIGWKDGMISCWMVDGRNRPSCTYSNNSQHNGRITILKWNPAGKRIITGDEKGVLCVWTVDSRATLNPIKQYRKKGEIICAVYCVLNQKVDSQQVLQVQAAGLRGKNAAVLNSMSPAFFFGTERGAVVYADDLGNSADVQQLTSPIDVMMFYEEKMRLVLITRSLLLTQYQVAEDGRVTRLMQVKLSVPPDVAPEKGLKSVVWAGPGVLALATHEKFVRLLDLAAEESYNLSLSVLGEVVDRSDYVVQVAFSALDRYLAVGTHQGVVGMWKYNGPTRDSGPNKGAGSVMPTSAAHWELQYKTTLNGPMAKLAWYGGQGTVAALTEDGVTLLTETKMRCGMSGGLAVIQTDTHEVSIHATGHVWMEHAGMIVRGLSVSPSCFVVWSGKIARVYRVDSSLANIDPQEPFASTAKAMAIADATNLTEEAIFAADEGVVKVLNFKGIQKSSIPFSENDGAPEHVSVNGTFLAVMTNKGVIQIFDVATPMRHKTVGGTGKFNLTPQSLVADSPAAPQTSEEMQQKLIMDLFGPKSKRHSPLNATANAANTTTTTAGAAAVSANSNKSSTSSTTATSTSTLKVREIRVNCKGNKVAILADSVQGALQLRHPESTLYVFDHSKGATISYDFAKDNRVPISIYWDEADDRMLVCEAQKVNSSVAAPEGAKSNKDEPQANEERGESKDDTDEPVGTDVEVIIFFATSTNGLFMQDSFPRKHPYGPLIGFDVPRLYFRNAVNQQDSESTSNNRVRVHSKVMSDFLGMENVDADTKTALLDFSFNLTLGKLDEAYRAVKKIGSPSIWENMANTCVKTKRVDVAEVCLAHMGHAVGAAALRDSKKEGSREVSIGVLAVHLGLLDEAARLFTEANRYDYLNKLYQSQGTWNKAIKVAKNFDRIHLKNTHYQYAKHLESIGDIDRAIEHYERSETSRTEVPRMLYTLGRMDALENYIHESSDAGLLKWWAAYLESIQRFDKAKKYYKKAGDYLSMVRIYCFQEDFSKASEIVAESGDHAAAYHFARQMEAQGHYNDAINFYADAGCYNHSIRLTREHNLDAEIMKFALRATPSLMLECASFFEERGEYEKAVSLYRRGGDLPRAMDLCFRAAELQKTNLPAGASRQQRADAEAAASGLFELLNAIAQDLGADSSPQTLARCADFLVKNKQFSKATELYVKAKRYNQAIDMCVQNKVNITDEMVEQLTPPETVEAGERREILLELAKALKKQGSYVLASKKYTQAGDRVHAMKCLVRGGDSKAVIQFANISRNIEIYKLAANYLQQMNWRESVDIMKAIIMFYSKAKAYEQLASFYESCAQVEIDDYRDYEKAIGALREALKYLAKAETKQAVDMAEMVEARIALIEKFVKAKRSPPAAMVEICEELLKEPLLEDAIRAGDCLSMLIEHHHASRDMKEAYACIREMEERRIPLHPYVDAQVLEEVLCANGVKDTSGPRTGGGGGGGGGGASSKRTSDDRDRDGSPAVNDDSNIDSDIEEDMDGESPAKNAKPVGKGPSTMVAASKGYAPVRGGDKKSSGVEAGAGNGGRAAHQDLDESVEEEVGVELHEEVDDQPKVARNEAKLSAPARQNRK